MKEETLDRIKKLIVRGREVIRDREESARSEARGIAEHQLTSLVREFVRGVEPAVFKSKINPTENNNLHTVSWALSHRLKFTMSIDVDEKKSVSPIWCEIFGVFGKANLSTRVEVNDYTEDDFAAFFAKNSSALQLD